MIFKYNKDFFILLLGRLLQIGVTLISLRVSTSLLPEAELGLVYYLTALQSFFSLFLINPVGQYFNRQTNRWLQEGVIFERFVSQSLFILFVVIFAFIFLIFLQYIGIINISTDLILVTSSLILAQSLNQTVIPLLNMLNRRGAFVVFNLLTAICCLVMSFILVNFVENSAICWSVGILIGTMIINLFAVKWLRLISFRVSMSNSASTNSDYVAIFKYILPIAFATFFLWFLGSGYRVIIEKFYGLEYLAAIGIGLAIASQFFTIAESLLSQFLLPTLYRNIELADYQTRLKAFNSYLRIVIPLYISLALFLTFSIKYLFPYLVAEKYHSFYIFAVYGVWTEVLRVLTNSFSVAAQIEQKTVKIVLPYVVGAFILFFGLFFQKYVEDKLVVMGLLVLSNFCVFSLMVIGMRRYLKFTFPFRQVLFMIMFVFPSVLFFYFVNFDAIVSFESLIYLIFGSGLYTLGVFFRIGKLIHD